MIVTIYPAGGFVPSCIAAEPGSGHARRFGNGPRENYRVERANFAGQAICRPPGAGGGARTRRVAHQDGEPEMIPDNEAWPHEPETARDLKAALEWAVVNPPNSSNAEEILAKLR